MCDTPTYLIYILVQVSHRNCTFLLFEDTGRGEGRELYPRPTSSYRATGTRISMIPVQHILVLYQVGIIQ